MSWVTCYFIGVALFGFIGWTYLYVIKDEVTGGQFVDKAGSVVWGAMGWPLALPLAVIGLLAKGTAYYIRIKFMGKTK